MFAKIVGFGDAGFPEDCLDEQAKFLVLIERLKEAAEVSSTGKTLSIIAGCRNQKVVSEPYGPPVQSHGADIVVSLSAYIPNPDAPKPEPKLSTRESSILRESAELLAGQNATANSPLMQQLANTLAKQLTGMK